VLKTDGTVWSFGYNNYGVLGIRHEDVIVVTQDGAENLTKWSGSPEDPARPRMPFAVCLSFGS
jgi:hypothetical protein